MTEIDPRLGDMVRSCREKLGITQEKMAEKVHVNLTHYGNFERGITNVSLPRFLQIAKEVNLSVDNYLYGKKDDTINQITHLLSQCSKREQKIILENIYTLLNNRNECTGIDSTD